MGKIKKLRRKIDLIDKKLVKLIEKRLKITEEIIDLKLKNNLTLTDSQREKEIIQKSRFFIKDGILKEKIKEIYEVIFNLSKSQSLLKAKKEIEFKNISIIGLGVMGGSIVKVLKCKNKKIKIFSLERKDKDIELALKEKYLDKVYNLEDLIKNSELIVLAIPIGIIPVLAKKIKKLSKDIEKNLIVIDIGSVKEKIAQEFEKLTDEKIEFLPTHPMAGFERSSFENSNPLIFLKYPWIITPHKKNKKETIEKIKKFIEYLGSDVKILSPKEHDKIVARISHLVFVLVKYLFAYVYETNKKYFKFAGTGFKSITRLVSGNPLMHYQIFINNKENIEKEIKNFVEFIEKNRFSKNNALRFFAKYKKLRDKIFR